MGLCAFLFVSLFVRMRVVDFCVDVAAEAVSPAKSRTESPRAFDPAKTAATCKSKQLVAEVLERIEKAERRQRRRRKADQERHESAAEALVCDLVHRALDDPDAWLMVEMSKGALSPQTRRAPFLTEAFLDLVKLLCHPEVAAAELQPGYYASWFGGERTMIRVSPWLDARIDDLEIHYEDIGRNQALLGDPLVLRSDKVRGSAKTLPLPDTQEVRALRAQMRQINSWLAQADISYVGPEPVDLGRRYLKRIFNNGSLQEGGRLYHGFWQDMSKEDRADYLRIEGAPVVSLDFAQMSVRTAYALVGTEPPEGDLYELPGVTGDRQGVKTVFNALLANAKVPTRMPRGARAHFARHETVHSVIAGIRRRHPALVPLFGKGQSCALMNLESQIIIGAMLRLQDRGVVALPIHDGILVADHRMEVAKRALEEASKDVLGQQLRVEVEGSPPRGLHGPSIVNPQSSPLVGGISA